MFKDIGGTAILAGNYWRRRKEIHLPYNPKDEREICDDILIKNNLITDATNEDWGCCRYWLWFYKQNNYSNIMKLKMFHTAALAWAGDGTRTEYDEG